MAAPVPQAVVHALELLSGLGRTRSCRMFGGHALYIDDLVVALYLGRRLYLKTDDACRGRFEGSGGEPFSYTGGKGRTVTTGYWTVPDEAMESPDAMAPWARLALQASRQALSRRRPARSRSA